MNIMSLVFKVESSAVFDGIPFLHVHGDQFDRLYVLVTVGSPGTSISQKAVNPVIKA